MNTMLHNILSNADSTTLGLLGYKEMGLEYQRGLEKSLNPNLQGGVKVTRRTIVFLSQIYIKVTLSSSQNEEAENNRTVSISVIFSLIKFICKPEYLL